MRLNQRGFRGKGFEKRIYEESFLSNQTLIQVPQKWKNVERGKPEREKVPCDFMMSINGRAVFFDAKQTFDHAGVNLLSNVTGHAKIHQLTFLVEANNRNDIAGYLIHFAHKDYCKVGFISATNVWNIWNNYRDIKALLPSHCESIQDDHLQLNFSKLMVPPLALTSEAHRDLNLRNDDPETH